MSIRIGIMGYGNLGRGVECAIRQNPDMELKAVFTRRAPETVSILTEGVPVYRADVPSPCVFGVFRPAVYVNGAALAEPERLRLTLVLFYFRDMQVASCAQVLGVPEGTVKSRLNKARKLLKEALGHEADL